MHRFTSLLFCVVALVTHAANFIPTDAVDAAGLLPPPPAPDSLVQKAELEVLFQIQQQRTPAQVERTREVNNETLFSFAEKIVGPWFNPQTLPKTAALFKDLGVDYFAINRATKSLWNRPRPPFADPRIKPSVEFSDSPSYPSGHAIQAAMWATLLTELFPGHATEFQTRAAETCWFRIVAGAHFPTDIEAGKILGVAIAQAFLDNMKFQQRLAEVREEIAHAQQKKAA
jgi:acid phosphatase (class A)